MALWGLRSLCCIHSTTNKQTNTSIHRKIIAIIIIIDQIGVIIDFDGMSLSMHIAYIYICRHTIPSWLIEQADAFGSNETGILCQRDRAQSKHFHINFIFSGFPLSASLSLALDMSPWFNFWFCLTCHFLYLLHSPPHFRSLFCSPQSVPSQKWHCFMLTYGSDRN